SAPPTRQQMLKDVSKMEAALKTAAGPQVVQKVDAFVASKSVKEIQAGAIGALYEGKPESALLLGMKGAQKDPANVQGWNNLAAVMNMSGLEHQAIPILQHCLAEHPENSMLLNNLGQAFLGLGDLARSKDFFQRCLKFDDLHPEANRSMALIYLFGNDVANALKHFEKEFQVGQRKSSLAYLVKSGQRDKINLAALRKNKMRMDGADNRDFFSEISLTKFKLPDPPTSSLQKKEWLKEQESLLQSLEAEWQFWTKAAEVSPEQSIENGKRYHGRYKELVDELISDLGDQYIPLLGIIKKNDVPYLTRLGEDMVKEEQAIKCPTDPFGNFAAQEKICCDLKTPVIDKYMNEYNSFVSAKIKDAQSNYKQYINGLISAVQLDPSPGNKILVYLTVSNYFSFLQGAIQSYYLPDPYMTCNTSKLTSEEAKSLIESSRNIDLNCPSWLKLNVSFLVAKVKADCQAFNVEADVYKLIHVGMEKKLKTGTSTLYVGGGISGKWKGMAEGSIKQQFYVVWDQNNEFADVGMRGSASGSLAGGMIGAEFGYDFALNSGFNAQGKVKSTWIDNYEKALNFVAK
ncbi:MAG TPA: hypothetical protein VMR70_07390, partial [Flavisolibacter sp.]|nr:hypothetical protein [Flavisolibacter sp.]